jgi:tetratricopeptide (TPR) repeat protein
MAAPSRKNQLLYEICLELGECYAALGEVPAAEANFSEALTLQPTNPGPYIGLAKMALAQRHWEQAHFYLSQALKIIPENDEALGLLGTLLLKTGKPAAAWEEYNRALTLNPENREALLGLVQAISTPEQMSQATNYLMKYLDINLVDFPLLLKLAELLARQGKIKEAQEAVEKVLLFQPDNLEALTLLQSIKGEEMNAATLNEIKPRESLQPTI